MVKTYLLLPTEITDRYSHVDTGKVLTHHTVKAQKLVKGTTE